MFVKVIKIFFGSSILLADRCGPDISLQLFEPHLELYPILDATRIWQMEAKITTKLDKNTESNSSTST